MPCLGKSSGVSAGPIHRSVHDARFVIGLTKGFEPESRVEPNDVVLGMQHHRFTLELSEHLLHEPTGQPLTAPIRSRRDAPNNTVRITMLSIRVPQHPQIGGASALVGNPEMTRRWLFIAVIHLFVFGLLLEHEDIAAKLEEVVELLQC